MKQFIMLLAGLLISNFSVADEKYEGQLEAYASYSIMSQIQKPEDFLKLPYDDKEMAVVGDAVKNLDKKTFEVPLLSMPSPSSVEFKFSARTITVEYREIAKNILLVDGQEIKLDGNKTILNYKNEIDLALSKKTKSAFHFLIPDAHAESISKMIITPQMRENWNFYMGANAKLINRNQLTPETMKVPVTRNLLEREIERAYMADLNGYQTSVFGLGREYSEAARFHATLPIFTCSKNRLSRMETKILKASAGEITQAMKAPDVLERTAKGYKYDSNCYAIETDHKFMVTSSKETGRCFGGNFPPPAVGSAFLRSERQVYGQFPYIADACCRKNGCYESVQNSVSIALLEKGKAADAEVAKNKAKRAKSAK